MSVRILFLTLTLFPLFLPGQESRFRQFTTEDGLPSNNVYQVIQDKKGYLWFATEEGVAKYNGSVFKTFTVRDGLPNNDVFQLVEDFQGRIWVQSTSDKIAYIRADTVHVFDDLKVNNYGFNISVSPLSIDLLGAISNDERMFLSIDTLDNVICAGFRIKNNFALFKDQRFIRTKNSVTIVKDSSPVRKWNFLRSPKTTNFIISNGLLIFPDADIDVKELVLYEMENLKEHKINLFHQFKRNPNFVRYRKSKSNIFIITDLGILQIDDNFNISSKIVYPTFFNRNKIKQGLLDSEKGLWICTYGEGVYYLSSAQQTSGFIKIPEGTTPTAIKYFDNTLYIGDSDGNVYNTRDSEINTIYRSRKEKPNRSISYVDINYPNLYFSQRNSGIYTYNIDNQMTTNISNNAKIKFDAAATDLYQTYSSGKMSDWASNSIRKFIVTNEHLIYFNTKDAFKLVTKDYNTSLLYADTKRINDISSDLSSNLWLATNDGVIMIDSNTENAYSIPVPKSKINNIKTYKDNVIIAAESLGLYTFEKEKPRLLSDINATFSELEVKNDTLYAACNKGIYIFQIADKNGSINLKPIYHYNKKDGLDVVATSQIEISDNDIFVATAKGVFILNKIKPHKKAGTLPLYIEGIWSGDTPIKSSTNPSFDFNQNDFRFQFAALSYEPDIDIAYTYQLEGYDLSHKTNRSGAVDYPALPPGEYAFNVSAKDAYGIKSDTRTYVFKVKPAWWQTWYSKLAFWVGIAGFLYAILRYQIRSIKKKEKEKVNITQRLAELELSALQAQMNPHFLFNTLISIQNLINNGQNESAETYIEKMSVLLRMFLESSRNRFISLAEEMSMVDLYVQLEQLRFEDRFEYIKDEEEGLNLKEIKIPAALIHTFVENAISHGLFHKKDGGTLKISIKPKGENIICLIEDDGVGRSYANKVKKVKLKKYEPRGITIIMEKIAALKKIMAYEVTINIEDKTENGVPMGTLVAVTFPLKY